MSLIFFIIVSADAGKYYAGRVSYCGKAWDVHLDCVMKVGSVVHVIVM